MQTVKRLRQRGPHPGGREGERGGGVGAAAAFCRVFLGFLLVVQRGCLHLGEQVGNKTQSVPQLGVSLVWYRTRVTSS